ncbi:TPA: response regulator, partial [Aeromonas veronii]
MGKTILIVDDSATIRQVVGMTLKGAGYEVMEASDGKDALN